jgi:effector-binding domain-containing protein
VSGDEFQSGGHGDEGSTRDAVEEAVADLVADENDVTLPEIVDLEDQPAATIAAEVPMAEIGGFFDRAFTLLPEALAAQGIEARSAAFAYYAEAPGATAKVRVGYVVDRPIDAVGDVEPWTLPGGRVARVVHEGGFEGLGAAWGRLMAWTVGNGHRPAGGFWEVYLVEPTPDMDPADLRTELDCPIL